MPQDLAIALIVNLLLLLILSWAFFLVFLAKTPKKTKSESEQPAKKSKTAAESTPKEASAGEMAEYNDSELAEDEFFTTIMHQNKQQLESVEKVNSRFKDFDSGDEKVNKLQAEIRYLENQLQQSLQTINHHHNLRAQKRPAGDIDENAIDNDKAVQALRFKLSNTRSENLALREENKKISRQNENLKRYRAEHRAMANSVKEYIEQNKKNTVLISRLQAKLVAAQDAAEEARQALEYFQNIDTSSEAGLKEALERAERERQCIEDQYMELLKQLEDAEKVSQELERSQKECQQLERAYLDLVKEIESKDDDLSDNSISDEDDADFSDDDFGGSSTKNNTTPQPPILDDDSLDDMDLEEVSDINEKWLASLNEDKK